MTEIFDDKDAEKEGPSATFEASLRRSEEIALDIQANPGKYRVLTGDRPTGSLHIGHLFGSLANRIAVQNLGVTTFIVIADYQVLTDHDSSEQIATSVRELVIDYLAAGLNPESGRTFIFPHSHVPELNQLLLPFLNLVTIPELDRNPTVKEEIQAAGQRRVNAGMYTYPIHQAADILFCKGNVVPVGKDQLPHLEMTRKIARRFNERFAKNHPVFPTPEALLSEAPMVMGLDGKQKMSKSRNNTIMLSATADETAKLVKKATTDSERMITYDPEGRPEVANLLRIAALATGQTPETVAASIGDQGGGRLKAVVTESINSYLEPIRAKRMQLEKDPKFVADVLKKGIERAREEGQKTLAEVRQVMNMEYF